MGDWVELRVHGVSGTPPKSMLPMTQGDPKPFPLGGRSVAYRPVDRSGNEMRGPEGQVLEAFHWGGYTSGSRDQALWLLLLPFGMANAAQFMLPCGGGWPARALRAACGGALRVVALVLTVLFALAVAVGVLDLLVWQWLAPAGWLPAALLPVVLAVGVVVCAAVVIVLSRLGRAGRSVAEVVSRRKPAPGGREALANPLENRGDLPKAEPPGFSSPDFFAGDPDAPTLRRLHLTAGMLVVAALAWEAAGRLADDPSELAAWSARWTTWLLAGVAAMVLFLGDAPGAELRSRDVGRSAWGGVAAAVSVVALVAAVASSLGAVAVLVFTADPVLPTGRALPAVDGLVALVSATGLAALVGLGLLVVQLGLATRDLGSGVPSVFRRFAHGWAAALVAGLGLFLGVGFTAAATYVAQLLIDLAPGPAVRTTPLLQRVAFAWGVLALVLVALGVAVLGWVRRRTGVHAAVAGRTYLRAGRGPLAEGTAHRIGSAMAQARIKSVLPIVLLVVAAAGIVLTAALVVAQWRGRCQLARCRSGDTLGGLSGVAETDGWLVKGLTWLGVLVLVLLAVALFRIGWKAFRGSATRRAVNVVWDVIAFWPRAAHPFVPEPYSQDVVGKLRERIATLLQESGPDGRVVVAPHSQGSLIALAALRSLSPALCPRVGVLTFGSQLRLIFPRAFPAHVRYDVVAWLATEFGDRWVSLYRETDHIGGPVASWNRTEPDDPLESCHLGEDDGPLTDELHIDSLRRECGREWCLFDPPLDPVTGVPAEDLRKHSDYWLDRDWHLAVARALTGSGGQSRPVTKRSSASGSSGAASPVQATNWSGRTSTSDAP
jgi:hypothetical protein